MKITLNSLYQALLTDSKLIEISDNVPEEIRLAKQSERKPAIRKKFESITSSSANEKFKNLIASKKPDLFEILYLSEASTYPSTSEAYFPKDEIIKNKFDELNKRYHFFASPIKDEIYRDFITFFKSCKLMADFVELNNDESDSVAYLHAYKLMVLFPKSVSGPNPFAAIEAYLKTHNFYNETARQPLHDALLNYLPVISETSPIDIVAWRKLFKAGPQALALFAEAPQIEAINDHKTPTSYEEAARCHSRLNYPRGDEYPELAQVCHQYKVAEPIFNRCLAIEAILMGLFSFVTLVANKMHQTKALISMELASWYDKKDELTFSDILALVRREIWAKKHFSKSENQSDFGKHPDETITALIYQLSLAA